MNTSAREPSPSADAATVSPSDAGSPAGQVFAESGSWTGVGWYFSASHYDNVRKETHGHTYEVTAWFCANGRDAVVLQETLKGVLRAFDHKTLPPELSRAEDLAKAIGGLIGDCVGVDVSRPSERLHARWRV